MGTHTLFKIIHRAVAALIVVGAVILMTFYCAYAIAGRNYPSTRCYTTMPTVEFEAMLDGMPRNVITTSDGSLTTILWGKDHCSWLPPGSFNASLVEWLFGFGAAVALVALAVLVLTGLYAMYIWVIFGWSDSCTRVHCRCSCHDSRLHVAKTAQYALMVLALGVVVVYLTIFLQ